MSSAQSGVFERSGARGIFRIGGALPVRRLGFGALRVTGSGIWGPPDNPAAALELLRQVPAVGIDLIDTADSYGPHVSEQLIREALHPYPPGLVIATKGGFARPGPGKWVPLGRPEHLLEAARMSARRLGVETIDLWQLHRLDPKVPRDEQFDAIRTLIDDGVIRFAGLSEVDVETIRAAQAFFPVATVQNRYSLDDRAHEATLNYCDANGIGFIPFFPLGAGRLTDPNGPLGAVARTLGATPGQVALAWLLDRSRVVLPIPGTSQLDHLRENAAAGSITLSAAARDAIEVATGNAPDRRPSQPSQARGQS